MVCMGKCLPRFNSSYLVMIVAILPEGGSPHKSTQETPKYFYTPKSEYLFPFYPRVWPHLLLLLLVVIVPYYYLLQQKIVQMLVVYLDT